MLDETMDGTADGTCFQCDSPLEPDEALKCSVCALPRHFSCGGVTTDDFKNALKSGSAQWKCSSCLENDDDPKSLVAVESKLLDVDGQHAPTFTETSSTVDVKSLEAAIIQGVTQSIDVRLKRLEKLSVNSLKLHELLSAQLKAIQSELEYLSVSKNLDDDNEQEAPAPEPPKSLFSVWYQRIFYAFSFILPVIKKLKSSPEARAKLRKLPKFARMLFHVVVGGGGGCKKPVAQN